MPGSLGAATITQAQALKPYPYYTSINVRNPHLGNSIYHAGLLTVQKRFSQGLTLLASYTKAKLISDSVAAPINFGSVEQTGTTSYQNGLFNRRAERSIDPTDVPQRLALSAVYELPFGKGKLFNIDNRAMNAVCRRLAGADDHHAAEGQSDYSSRCEQQFGGPGRTLPDNPPNYRTQPRRPGSIPRLS